MECSITIDRLCPNDRILVTRLNGSDILKNEYTPIEFQNGSLKVAENIKLDTPKSGHIRIGKYSYTYEIYDKNTFYGINSEIKEDIFSPNIQVFVPFIDTLTSKDYETVSFEFVENFPISVRVRHNFSIDRIRLLPYEIHANVTKDGCIVTVPVWLRTMELKTSI